MSQGTLIFDLEEGERLRDAGIAQAADTIGRKFLLELAQDIATLYAQNYGTVTYDHVYAEMVAKGYNPDLLGNAAGNVFRGKEWEFSGEWKQSTRVSNHARAIRVWRLREGL